MLVRDNLLKPFLYVLKATNTGQGGIFQWHRSQLNLVTKSSEDLKCFQYFCHFGWIFVTGVTLQLLLCNNLTRPLLFQSILFTFVFISSFYIQLNLFWCREEISLHFNALLDFEQRYYRSYTCSREWISYLTEMILDLSIISSPALSLAYGGMLFMEPCIPCNLAYFIIPECRGSVVNFNGVFYDFLIKLPVILLNFVMGRFLISGFILDAAGLTPVQCNNLRTMLILVKKLLLGPRSHQKRAVRLFPQVHILEIIFNNFHRKSVVFEFATMSITLPISIFALIKVHPLNLAQKMFFFLAVIDTPIVILANFGILAEICNASNSLQKGLKTDLKIQKDKYLKRYVRSWPKLKARFGSGNFIDKLTPVKTLDLALNATASLLLMGW